MYFRAIAVTVAVMGMLLVPSLALGTGFSSPKPFVQVLYTVSGDSGWSKVTESFRDGDGHYGVSTKNRKMMIRTGFSVRVWDRLSDYNRKKAVYLFPYLNVYRATEQAFVVSRGDRGVMDTTHSLNYGGGLKVGVELRDPSYPYENYFCKAEIGSEVYKEPYPGPGNYVWNIYISINMGFDWRGMEIRFASVEVGWSEKTLGMSRLGIGLGKSF